jgi:release factor glutamine methyltransferase
MLTTASSSRIETLIGSGVAVLATAMPHVSRERLRVEAQTLLAKAADLCDGRQALLMASPDISERAARDYALLVRRRAAREPLAHLTGRTEFYSLEFELSKDVLTPRPESELIVTMALETPQLIAPSTTVVDIGVGSGCLLLSVLSHVAASVRGIGLDVSANALVVAQRNAVRLGMLPRTRFLVSNWLEQLPLVRENSSRDSLLLLCNPPYVESRDAAVEEHPELLFEPPEALFGTPEETYAALFRSAATRVPRDTPMLLEFGATQRARVEQVAQHNGWRVERVERDAGGHERVALLRLSQG